MKRETYSFLVKIVAPSVITMVLYSIFLIGFIIPGIETQIMNRKKEMIRELSNANFSVLEQFYQRSVENPEMEDRIKKAALQLVNNIRYGDDNNSYFWITDTNATIICHPFKPSLVNVPPDQIMDSAVAKLLYEIKYTAEKQGEGFINYYWENPIDSKRKEPKLSYINSLNGWGWIIGTGVYLNDVQKEMTSVKNKIIFFSAGVLLIISFIFVFIIRQSFNIETSKRESEIALRVSERKFKSLFDSANDSILILDEALNILEVNDKTLELQGYTREEIIGQSALVFSAGTQEGGVSAVDMATAMLQNALNGKPESKEWKLANPDGTYKYTWITMNGFKVGRVQYVMVILRDLTERKKMEQEQLKTIVQLEEAERSRFAKELHDGVGPIFSTVKLYFQWLSETRDEEKRKSIIAKGNQNIDEAITALKEISYNLSPHILKNHGLEVAINQFIERVSETSNIRFKFTAVLYKRLLAEVELTLYRVIIELVNNTLKYAEAKCTIIKVMADPTRGILLVRYCDDGKGFDVDEVMQEQKGLGLHNIQSRIKTLGGEAYFRGVKNSGFYVNIQLPITQYYEQRNT